VAIIYVAVLFAAGFLTNFISAGTINTGTILLYLLSCLLSVIGLIHLVNPLRKNVAAAVLATLILSSLMVTKSMIDANPISDRIKELAIYFLGAWPLLFFIQVDKPRVHQQLLRTLELGLLGLSLFGILQGLFATSLPLNLFVLRGDDAFGVGDDQLRPTGLTGNPIIFSSILVFASALFLSRWLEKRKLKYVFALLSSLYANYLTYTRASIVLVIPVLIFVSLFHNRFHIKHKLFAVCAIIVAIAVGQYLFFNPSNLLIIARLQNSNDASTLGHFQQIQDATEAIATHPIMGTGMGSEGDFLGSDNMIITDGAWFALLLEFGIPLSIVILLLLFAALLLIAKYVLRRESNNRALGIATLSFHAYILPANFINSALLGHVSFGLYWVVLALSLACATCGDFWATLQECGKYQTTHH
jgi:hypothetical protein